MNNIKNGFSNLFTLIKGARFISYKSTFTESNNIRIEQQNKASGKGWTIITFFCSSFNSYLNPDLFVQLLKVFVTYLTPENTCFIIKVEYQSGDSRSLMPMQIINNQTSIEEILGLIHYYLNIKDNWYKTALVHNVSIMFKATTDQVRLTRPLDNSEEVLNYLKYLPYIPTSFDLTTWGNEVEGLKGYITIISFDNIFKYEIRRDITSYGVTVYTLATNKPTRKSTYKILANFNMISMDSSDLTHVSINLSLHGEHFNFELKSGFLINGVLPYNLNFMESLDSSKEANWYSNKVITLDIETVTRNNVITPYAVGIYDGSTYQSFYLTDFKDVDHIMLKALRYLKQAKYNGYTVYAHNLSNFDSIFLLKYLVILSPNHKLNPIMRSGKLISLVFNFNIGKLACSIRFNDSLNLLPSSLSKLAKSFNVETQKDVFPYEFANKVSLDYVGSIPDISYFNNINIVDYISYVQRFVDDTWSLKNETLFYLKADCVSLYQVIQAFGNIMFNDHKIDITTTPTLPSLAFKAYRTDYIKTRNIPLIDEGLYNILVNAYYGGLVDHYIPYGKNLYYYDVNSLYPYAMTNPMPVGNPTHIIGTEYIDFENFFGFIKAQIVAPSNLKIPVLPVKHNGKLLCTTGVWTGWYFSEELRDARDNFGYQITPLEGYKFESEIIFSDYVNHYYDMKRLADQTNDPALRLIAKLFLNSLYGRFGMSPLLEETTISPSSIGFGNKLVTDINILNEDLDIVTTESVGTDLNINVAIAAAITGYSRIHINQFKRLPGYIVYYSDTDSIVLNKPLPGHMVGSDLGQMKLEYVIREGLFLGPKMYALITDTGKTIIKIRGLSEVNFGFNEIITLISESMTAKHTLWFRDINKGVINLREQIFTLIASNSKRVLIRDPQGHFIDTAPYILQDNVLITSSISVQPGIAYHHYWV
jgi:hypothetical protein